MHRLRRRVAPLRAARSIFTSPSRCVVPPLADRARMAQRDAQARMQFGHAEGLGQVVVRPRIEGLDLLLLLRSRRQHDDRPPRPAAQAADEIAAVAIRQPEVDEEQVDAAIAGQRLAVARVGRLEHLVALGLQRGAQQPPDRLLVLDHQHVAARSRCGIRAGLLDRRAGVAGCGSVSVNRAPPSLRTSMRAAVQARHRGADGQAEPGAARRPARGARG